MLQMRAAWELPVLEASALCMTQDGGGTARLLAVDDERYELATAEIADGDLGPGAKTSVRTAVPDADSRSSEFEGVAVDGDSCVFVVQEGADRILVLDPELQSVTRVIALSVPPDQPEFGEEWESDPNARAEGLLLLDNGHILIAKQRKEPRLIEFGPPGSAAEGFARGGALAPGDAFPLEGDGDVTFEVLASWLVDPKAGIKSVNDLACDEDGRLYVVSSKSRVLARVDGDLAPEGGLARLTPWKLPGDLFETDDDKAEGLVFTPQLGWLVALDLDRAAPNVYAISGVPR
jgi:sugar lactone lactonase YvrE